MHSIQLGDYSIHFNGDFSGHILVDKQHETSEGRPQRVAEIPFMVMAAVVGEKLRREKMTELERISDLDPLEAFKRLVYPNEPA